MFRAMQLRGSVVQSEKRAWHANTSYRYDRGPWRREHFRWHAESVTTPLPLSTIDNVRRSADEGAPRASSFPLHQDGLQHSVGEHAAVRHPKSSHHQAVLHAITRRSKSAMLRQYRSRVLIGESGHFVYGHHIFAWSSRVRAGQGLPVGCSVVCSVPRTYRRMHER
jgi:hypothetical protein